MAAARQGEGRDGPESARMVNNAGLQQKAADFLAHLEATLARIWEAAGQVRDHDQHRRPAIGHKLRHRGQMHALKRCPGR